MTQDKSSRYETALGVICFFLTVILAFSSAYIVISDPLFKAMIRLSRQTDLLAQRYVGDLSPERVFEDGWKGMQQAIPFKVELVTNPDSTVSKPPASDWGLVLNYSGGNAEVMSVALNSPLQGVLRRNDYILGIGDHRSNLMTNMRNYLEEFAGDSALLFFRRNEKDDSTKILLKRPPQPPGFTHESLDGILYLGISLFDNSSKKQLLELLNTELIDSIGGVIIDLRGSVASLTSGADEMAAACLNHLSKFGRKTAVLLDESTSGEGEEFAAKLLESENFVAVGRPTAGARGKRSEILLRNGAKLLVSTDQRNPYFQLASLEDDSVFLKRITEARTMNRIIPTVACSTKAPPGLILDLIHRGYLVDFVADSTYDSLPQPADEARLFSSFESYLAKKNYKYNPTEAALGDLELNPQTPDIRQPIANLRKIQNTLVTADLDEFREEIIRRLLGLIQEIRIGGVTSAAIKIRTDDNCLQTAVEYLRRAAS